MMRTGHASDEREGLCVEDTHETVGAADKYTILSYTDGVRTVSLQNTTAAVVIVREC